MPVVCNMLPTHHWKFKTERNIILLLQRDTQKGYESHRGIAVLQLVDGQDAVDHQLGLAVDERWKDQTRAVTQHQVLLHVQRLQMATFYMSLESIHF